MLSSSVKGNVLWGLGMDKRTHKKDFHFHSSHMMRPQMGHCYIEH